MYDFICFTAVLSYDIALNCDNPVHYCLHAYFFIPSHFYQSMPILQIRKLTAKKLHAHWLHFSPIPNAPAGSRARRPVLDKGCACNGWVPLQIVEWVGRDFWAPPSHGSSLMRRWCLKTESHRLAELCVESSSLVVVTDMHQTRWARKNSLLC